MKKEVKIALIVAGVLVVGFIGYNMYTKSKKPAVVTPEMTTRPSAFADKPKSETMAQTISKAV